MDHKDNTELRLGQCACDADLFARVWERMGMVGDESCPVEMDRPAAMPTPQEARHEVSAERTEQMERMEEDGNTVDDFPPPDELPCLGSGSASHAAQLQRYIWEELESWQLYRNLARRVSGPHARTLTALASGKHRNARRLAAAYFLIAGVRWWPTDRLGQPRITGWLGVLRDSFSAEQRKAHRYRAAVCDTADPCLAELYAELARECAAHAAALRTILENAL